MPLTADRCRRIAVELGLGLCLFVLAQVTSAATRVTLQGGEKALLTDEQQLFLEAMPRRGEGWLGFAERLTGSVKTVPLVGAANGGSSRLLLGKRYRLPFELLSPSNQRRVVLAGRSAAIIRRGGLLRFQSKKSRHSNGMRK